MSEVKQLEKPFHRRQDINLPFRIRDTDEKSIPGGRQHEQTQSQHGFVEIPR